MKLHTKYIFNIIIVISGLLICSKALAQEDSLSIYVPDSTFFQRKMAADSFRILQQAEMESLKKANKVKAIDTTSRFGLVLLVDYGKLLTIPTDFETKYEASAGLILFRRLVFEVIYGSADLNPTHAYKNTEKYNIKGNYYKAGLQYRFILNPANPRNFIYLGADYAMSQYSDDGKFVIGSDYWDNYGKRFGSDNMNATWSEIYMLTEAYINKRSQHFLAGLRISLRYMIDFDTRTDIPVYSVPGYGRTFDKTVPAANFYIKYKLPF